MRYPLSPRSGYRRSGEPSPGQLLPRWPCLLPDIVVGVVPLRDLTGEADRQGLVEGFTDRLVTDLFRHCRGLSFAWVADERRCAENLPPRNPPQLSYVVYGSVQRGGSQGMLRVNIRISDAMTADYLWAGRQEFRPEDVAPIQTKITLQISRALHILLLQEASRRVLIGLDTGLKVEKCLFGAETALRGGMCSELTAEAQRWFLAALAGEPRNVEALTGLALTCQHLVSNPWWDDPRACAAAADLGHEAVSLALELKPTHARAKTIQGMLYSAAGRLEEAADAFAQALEMDDGLAAAHAFAGYNAALLGRAWETLPAIERAMRLDSTDRRHSVWYFFGGFAELLLGRTEAAIALLSKSLELNPNYGAAQLFLMAALSLHGRPDEAARLAGSFRSQNPEYPARAFEQLWLSRSNSPVYRAQVYPLFESIRTL
jgi:tetratricopeptide (TPR) repeat protein